MPTKWIKVAGIMFSFGDQGSGKSTIASLANFIHGFKSTFSPDDTFASLRNALDAMRWINPQDKSMEREGGLLAWDNLNAHTLKNDNRIYQLLLVGYSRLTDRLQIAGSDGTNKEYYVFCPKILSSVEPLHLHHDFKELRRRLLVIPHKPWERFTPDEKKHYEGYDIATDKIDLDSISWCGVENNYYEYWNDETNCKTFVGWRGILTKKGKKGFSIPKVISSTRWTISVDIIATGLTLGAWEDVQDAVDYMAEYWEYCDKYVFGEFSATLEHLRLFIEEEIGVLRTLNEQLANNGVKTHPIVISPKKVKDKLSVLQAQGGLDITPSTKDVNALMWELGFKLTTKGWIEK